MKSFFAIVLPILLLGSLLTACVRDQSVNVNQDTIYATYRLVYEAEEDKTYARATFRFSGATGTILELSSPAEVNVDSLPLSWRPISAYYETDFAGLKSTGNFSYTDLDGNTFINDVELADSVAFAASLDTIRKGSAFTLIWEGEPIEAGESVIVTISTGLGEDETKIFTTSNVSATSIILPADRLGEIPNGEASIFIERRLDQLLDQGTSEGGAIWSRYIGLEKRIQLVD